MIEDIILKGQPRTNVFLMDREFCRGDDAEMADAFDQALQNIRGDGFACTALSTDGSHIVTIHNRTFWVNCSGSGKEARVRLARCRKWYF